MSFGISGLLLILIVVGFVFGLTVGIPAAKNALDEYLAKRDITLELVKQEKLKTEILERQLVDETLERESKRDRNISDIERMISNEE